MRGLDWLNFFMADVQTGVGPFLAIYLVSRHWNVEQVGFALTIGGLAGVIFQTPAGALVDRIRAKRLLIAAAVIVVAACSFLLAMVPSVSAVVAAQVALGMAAPVFGPAVAAISLGMVGHRLLPLRVGRNQMLNSGGNVIAALLMGLVAYWFSDRAIFFLVVALAAPALVALASIRPREIDYDLARGAKHDDSAPTISRFTTLIHSRRLMTFAFCAVLFHFSNAAMLPMLGEMLSQGKGRQSALFMSACVITTQVVVTLIATWVGKRSASWGRKPLLLIGFGVLPIRGVLYTLTSNTTLLVAIQILDGIGAAVFGVVSLLVIADLTRGTGRYNLTQGALGTAVGIGASLSTAFAGFLVHRFGYSAGFLSLAGIAAIAVVVLWLAMPETRPESGGTQAPAPLSGQPEFV